MTTRNTANPVPALVLRYWRIGQRIRTDILKEKRAEYGEKIFYALSRKLTAELKNSNSTRQSGWRGCGCKLCAGAPARTRCHE